MVILTAGTFFFVSASPTLGTLAPGIAVYDRIDGSNGSQYAFTIEPDDWYGAAAEAGGIGGLFLRGNRRILNQFFCRQLHL